MGLCFAKPTIFIIKEEHMGRSRLSTRFTLYNWNKFSKEFKQNYKKENEEPLQMNTAVYLTFEKIRSKKLFDGGTSRIGFRDPEIEDVVTLIKLGNNNTNEEQAVQILENYLEDESTGKYGVTGAFLDLCCDFFNDLKLSVEHKKKIEDIRDTYKETVDLYDKLDTGNTEEDKDDTKENIEAE